jgi:predicted permease
MYIPSLGAVGHYFKRRRALAMGIAASGSSVGGVIHPIMLNHLFHGSAGFHVGVRASAGLNLGLMTIGVLLIRPRLPPTREGNRMLPQLWTFCQDPPYIFAILGYIFTLRICSITMA